MIKYGFQEKGMYTKEELKYYFQTMKEKYKHAPAGWNFKSVELSMFDEDFKSDNIDTILNNRKEQNMWDFLFESIETGEQFFVECESVNKAKIILEMSGFKENEIKYINKYTIEEAEMMGFDTY